ncbi:hypothetical protein ACHAQJ_004981 [Trichoderma viride]
MSNQKPSFYVPEVIKKSDGVFLMSATHRGDMYHLRAALKLPSRKKYSVVLYNSNHENNGKPKTKDLEDYLAHSLSKNEQHIFAVPWTYNELNPKDNKRPTHFAGCFLDGKPYDGKDYDKENPHGKAIQRHELVTYNESAATGFIAKEPKDFQAVVDGMAVLSQTLKDKLSVEFAEIWKKSGIEAHQPAILFLYRDTGTSDSMGVYPELDTGDAIQEIRMMVNQLPSKDGKKIKVFSCGLEGAQREPGIGEYWKHISKPKPGDNTTARDIEAYFLKWSFDHKYYTMASGFRSGPLDLFTFMNIPTVSIGLRNMKGESRHTWLADKKFKRVVIQYDQPRHNTSVCIRPKPTSKNTIVNPIVYTSPFWPGEQEFKPPIGAKKLRDTSIKQEDKKKQQTKKPRSFEPFDMRVIEIGYRFACQQYMGLSESVYKLQSALTHTIDTRAARYCYLNKDKTEQRKYLRESKELDERDIKAMKGKLDDKATTLQQSEKMFEIYQKESTEDWEKMKTQL